MTSDSNRRSLLARAGAVLAGLSAGFGIRSASAQISSLPAKTILNIGLNVSNLEHSKRFYMEALDFEDGGKVNSHPPHCATVFFGRNGADYLKSLGGLAYGDMWHVKMNGVQLLLREFTKPKYTGTKDVPPTHALGLSNISVRVDSIEKRAAMIRKLGGQVFEGTWVKKGDKAGNGGAGMIFCADPDGIQLELVEI